MGQETPVILIVIVGLVCVSLPAIQRAIRAGPGQALCRGLLLLGIWAWAVPLIPLCGVAYHECPPLLLVPAAILFLCFRSQIVDALWLKGTSRWADYLDLLENINCHGILLGQLPAPSIREALTILWRAPLRHSAQACVLFLAAVRHKPLTFSATNTVHSVFFAPAGAGKSTAVAVPFLLTCQDSYIVIDIKGELAKLTADYRRSLGHEVVILDPWRLVTNVPDCLNPLDLIDLKNINSLDDIRSFVDALIIRPPDPKEPHWDDTAELVVTAFAALLKAELPRACNPQEVTDLIASPEDFAKALIAMRESDAWGGLLARMGNQLSHLAGRHDSTTRGPSTGAGSGPALHQPHLPAIRHPAGRSGSDHRTPDGRQLGPHPPPPRARAPRQLPACLLADPVVRHRPGMCVGPLPPPTLPSQRHRHARRRRHRRWAQG
jgi:hypothetical protein